MPRFIVYLLHVILLIQLTKGVVSNCHWLQDCSSHLIGFYLYNNYYKDGYQMLLEDKNTIKTATFQQMDSPRFPKSIRIKIVIHGYTGWRNRDIMIELRKKYFENGNWNIIYIDFKELAKENCYVQLFWSVSNIAKCGTIFIQNLLDLRRNEITCDQFDVIAFSIGAHVAAQISNNLGLNCFPRIIGIDPALPFFYPFVVSRNEKLNKRHAKFVISIHSNTGIYGVFYSNAHVDVYINNGITQPGCGLLDVLCSHRRSLECFIESINSDVGFIATQCNNYLIYLGMCVLNFDKVIIVGEYSEPVKPEDEGIYYLPTNTQPPYAVGFGING